MIKKSIIFITSILILNSCNMNDYSELNEGIYANLETSKGDIILELFFKQTPLTVALILLHYLKEITLQQMNNFLENHIMMVLNFTE